MKFKVTSPAVLDGRLEDRYGNKSEENNLAYDIPLTSFPLQWEGAPAETRSYAIIFMDNDNAKDEGFPFVHWLACNIPGEATGICEDASRKENFLVQGTNSWVTPYGPYAGIPKELTLRFGGPAPSYEHEYELTLYALDQFLELEEGYYYNDLRKAIRGHVLAETELLFFYG